MMKIKAVIAATLFTAVFTEVFAANLADPAVLVPPARIAAGASYDLDGFSITNNEVPCLTNRFEARISFSPFSFVNFGIDGGTLQMEVAGDTTASDTFSVFHGRYGICGGGHLKLSTPFFFNDLACLVGIARGSYFSSKSNAGASYGGLDASGGAGIQIHLKDFGYLTLGSTVYLILGKNKSFDGTMSKYSNVNNVRGWLALDYFPALGEASRNIVYVSIELSVGPNVTFNERVPVQEMSVSVSIGAISRKLYGATPNLEWKP
jgi:hypothetical protein